MLVIGVVLLIVGVALVSVSRVEIPSQVNMETSMTLDGTGMWVSHELNATPSSSITVNAKSADFGLIKASSLSAVNSSNLGNYRLSPNTASNGVDIYLHLSGSYYVVVFSSSQPAPSYSLIKNVGMVAIYGLLFLVGLVLAIAGVIVAIIGAVRKPKVAPQ